MHGLPVSHYACNACWHDLSSVSTMCCFVSVCLTESAFFFFFDCVSLASSLVSFAFLTCRLPNWSFQKKIAVVQQHSFSGYLAVIMWRLSNAPCVRNCRNSLFHQFVHLKNYHTRLFTEQHGISFFYPSHLWIQVTFQRCFTCNDECLHKSH